MSWTRLALVLLAKAAANPSTGIALLRVGWRFRRRDWFRRFPFLPLPDRAYMRWRMHTAYGRDDALPDAADVVRFARWATRDP